MIINSTQNKIIIDIAKLKIKKYRDKNKMFIAEGIRVINTFIDAGFKPIYFFSTNLEDKNKILVSEEVMKKLSSAESPSGYLAVFNIPNYNNKKLKKGVVAAKIQDPGNLGTILRSTAAFGYKTAVLVESCDPWSYKVVQASAGALSYLEIHNISWQELALQSTLNNLELTGLVVPSKTNINNINNFKKKNILIVVGNEANGIPDEWLDYCPNKVTIPISNNIESLNAGVACSIALYLFSN